MDVEFDQPYRLLAIFSALLCFMLVRQESASTRTMFVSGWTIATRTGLGWLVVVGTLLLIGYATKVSELYSRRVLLLWFVGTPPLLMAAPVLLRAYLHRVAAASAHVRPVAIAGVTDVGRQLAQRVAARPELGLDHRGFVEDRAPGRFLHAEPGRLRGTLEDLPAVAKRRQGDI